MTAQPGVSQPVFNISVTHVGLCPTGLESVHRRGREVQLNFATTRVVLLALNTVAGPAGNGPVQDFHDWPVWHAPGVPDPIHQWKAIFSIEARAFEGLYCAAADQGEPTIIRNEVPGQVTDAMWQMLQASHSVVLCAGLAEDPTAAEIASAAEQGKLRAVLAEAMFH